MNRSYYLSCVLLVALLSLTRVSAQVSVWDGTYAPWTNGTGTESDPFLIENAQQLAYLANRVNNGLDAAGGHVSNHNLHYKLMTDVNLNGSQSFQWTPIGNWISETNYYSFGGHFDGNNHTVSGLYVNSSADRVGFFGYTDGAEIKNLSVFGSGVSTTGHYAGGIAGFANSTIISGSNNDCNVSLVPTTSTSISNSHAGGIVGYSSSTMNITNCYNTGDISSSTPAPSSYSYSGGIVGYSNSTMTITNCYNTGGISSSAPCSSYGSYSYSYSGGIVGYSNKMTITNCYNMGNITSSAYSSSGSYSGGIGGYCYNYTSSSSLSIKNSYNVGNVNSGHSGGILGAKGGNYGGFAVINCYYLDTCGGDNTYGGSPMSSAAMKTSDFVNILNNGSCSWEQDIYPYTNVGYPTLTLIMLSTNTLDASNVTQTHATLKGTIFVENDIILSTGFMYKATNDASYTLTTCNNVTDTLTYSLTGLTPLTNYSYKAYLVTAGCDTTFGSDKTFSTSSVNVSTYYATNVTQTHATINGSLSMGDATVTNQGFEYKKYGDANWIQVTVPYSSNISYTISNLIPNTKYVFRSFATATECGTIYSATTSFPYFTTLSVSSTTNNATNITQTHATLNGSFTIGDANMSSYGFEYRKHTDTVFQTVTVSGEGSVSETVTGLTPSTQYTYRTFCTAVGCETVYGNYRNFTTQAISVTTNAATNLTESSATLNGSMSMGDATVTNQGFEYRVVGDANFTTVNATGGADNFSSSLYGLPVNNFYEYRAFVTISENAEPYYGAIQSFEVSWLNADTILIYDANMLQWVSDRCNGGITFEGKYIKLMNNIVLPLNQPNNMTSIGSYPYYPFKGTFDGNGMLITNLYIDHPNTEYQGFFGYTLNANLYEVGLVNITASGRNYTGGMVAYAENTYMRDCYVNGGSLFALSYCGGLVGYQDEGTNSIISGCYNTCSVSGNHYVGGLVGFSNYATVRNSYVAASVTGQGYGIGAIIGGAEEVLMYNCFFSSSITGQTYAIGENNFKDDEGMTDEEMRDPAFVATLNQGLVVPVWKSDYSTPINNGFPILIWQYSDVETCEAPENLNYTISGDAAILTWNGGENASYFVVEYGIPGSETYSENTSSHQITLHNLQNANYFWRVKSVCPFGESNFVNGNTITVGINDYSKLFSCVQLYPNPSHGFTTIQLQEDAQELETIQLFDINGKMLLNEKSIGKKHQLNIEMLKPGMYFIRISTTGNQIATLKLTVD